MKCRLPIVIADRGSGQGGQSKNGMPPGIGSATANPDVQFRPPAPGQLPIGTMDARGAIREGLLIAEALEPYL